MICVLPSVCHAGAKNPQSENAFVTLESWIVELTNTRLLFGRRRTELLLGPFVTSLSQRGAPFHSPSARRTLPATSVNSVGVSVIEDSHIQEVLFVVFRLERMDGNDGPPPENLTALPLPLPDPFLVTVALPFS